MIRVISGNREMHITRFQPQVKWTTVSKNLHETPVPDTSRATWYRVIHDIIPTNVRLHNIRLAPTDSCRNCGKKDTIEHRIVDCGEGVQMWTWTKKQIAKIMRTEPSSIPESWTTCPQFTLWPPQRNRAVLWLLANITTFRTQRQRNLTLQDFLQFLKRTRWKLLSYTTVLWLTGSVVFLYNINICIVCSTNKAASSKLQNTCCLTKMLIQQEARSSMSHIIS